MDIDISYVVAASRGDIDFRFSVGKGVIRSNRLNITRALQKLTMDM
jgi:hypothetical protein